MNGEFTKQLDLFIEDTKKEQARIVRKAILILFTRIVTRTPVDKGVLRNNWYVSVGGPSSQTTTYAAKTGKATIERGRKRLANINGTTVPIPASVFITNNLPYAYAIEYGHSKQAVNGMVRISLAEWDQIVKAAIANSSE